MNTANQPRSSMNNASTSTANLASARPGNTRGYEIDTENLGIKGVSLQQQQDKGSLAAGGIRSDAPAVQKAASRSTLLEPTASSSVAMDGAPSVAAFPSAAAPAQASTGAPLPRTGARLSPASSIQNMPASSPSTRSALPSQNPSTTSFTTLTSSSQHRSGDLPSATPSREQGESAAQPLQGPAHAGATWRGMDSKSHFPGMAAFPTGTMNSNINALEPLMYPAAPPFPAPIFAPPGSSTSEETYFSQQQWVDNNESPRQPRSHQRTYTVKSERRVVSHSYYISPAGAALMPPIAPAAFAQPSPMNAVSMLREHWDWLPQVASAKEANMRSSHHSSASSTFSLPSRKEDARSFVAPSPGNGQRSVPGSAAFQGEQPQPQMQQPATMSSTHTNRSSFDAGRQQRELDQQREQQQREQMQREQQQHEQQQREQMQREQQQREQQQREQLQREQEQRERQQREQEQQQRLHQQQLLKEQQQLEQRLQQEHEEQHRLEQAIQQQQQQQQQQRQQQQEQQQQQQQLQRQGSQRSTTLNPGRAVRPASHMTTNFQPQPVYQNDLSRQQSFGLGGTRDRAVASTQLEGTVRGVPSSFLPGATRSRDAAAAGMATATATEAMPFREHKKATMSPSRTSLTPIALTHASGATPTSRVSGSRLQPAVPTAATLKQPRVDSKRQSGLFMPSSLFRNSRDSGQLQQRSLGAGDMMDTPNGVLVRMDVPGIPSENIKITLTADDKVLTVTAWRMEDTRDSEFHVRQKERPTGSFTRAFNLPSNIDPHRVSAELHDGVLFVRVPTVQEEAARSARG